MLPDAAAPGAPPEVVATVGNFDGVHLGHRALLQRVIEQARERGLESAVITFEPHPRQVLRPDESLHRLSPLDERVDLLRGAGIENVLVWRFDEALRSMEAADFLDAQAPYVRVRHLIHGPGFAMGRGRRGTEEVLAKLGRERGFTLEQVELTREPGESEAAPITSTKLREEIEDGRVREAARALGRPPTLTGVVVEGEKVGRALGFPTANLDLGGPFAVPADGVYAAWTELDPFSDRARGVPSAVSIGERPTFNGRQRVVEAHLLDFDGDLYGQRLRLHFVDRLRGQERFDSVAALVEQMKRDVNVARRRLSGELVGDGLAADG